MAILNRCCCWNSVRDGSFACGIYTMIFYTLVVTVGTFHINPAIENKVLFAFALLALLLSGMCVMSSALLLVGLCADNRSFLLPWLVCVSMTTLLDVFLSLYFIAEESTDVLLTILFVTDFMICALNVYCLLCVISQYQEYLAGRGRPEDCLRIESQPEPRALKFHWPSFQILDGPDQTTTDGQATSSDLPDLPRPSSGFLVVPGLSAAEVMVSKCHLSTESVASSAASTRLFVEISRNETSKNTQSLQSACFER